MLDFRVPLQELNRFYFEQVVGSMADPLRRLATDLRILRGSTIEQHVDTLQGVYATDEYTFLPWLLDDIFNMPEEARLGIGQAWLLILMAHVILDQSTDRDMPAIPTIPLVQQHLFVRAGEILRCQFDSAGPVWERYAVCLSEYVIALAVESDCLDAQAQPYTYEMMQGICAGKAAPFRFAIYALALKSWNLQPLACLNAAFDKLLLVDQLVDDALDWRKDYQAGRRTLPVLLALEAEDNAGKLASRPSLEEMSARIEHSGILIGMTEQALSILEDVRNSLKKADLETTKLYAFFDRRAEITRNHQRRYQAIRLLGGLSSLLAVE